jgi:hypothetical protein
MYSIIYKYQTDIKLFTLIIRNKHISQEVYTYINRKLHVYLIFMWYSGRDGKGVVSISVKGSPVPVALACVVSGEGSGQFWSYVCSLPLHFYKRLFPGHDLMVTRQQLYHKMVLCIHGVKQFLDIS